MPINTLDHQHLYYFYWVATLKNFTQAAKKNRCSKSHISKAISQLESDLKTKLFQRTTRHIELTESGEHLLTVVSKLFKDLDEGLDTLQTLTNKPAGHIRLSAPPALAKSMLAPLIAAFIKHYPDISIHCDCESTVVDLVKDNYDLAFRNTKLPDSTDIARHLTDIQFVCVASHTCASVIKKIKRPHDIEDYAIFAYNMPGGIEWLFEKDGCKEHVHLNPSFTSNLSMMILATLQSSKGIAILPDFLIQDELNNKSITQVLPQWTLRKNPLYLVYPSKEFMPLKTRVLINFIVDWFKNINKKRI